jgi:hypothetical protein
METNDVKARTGRRAAGRDFVEVFAGLEEYVRQEKSRRRAGGNDLGQQTERTAKQTLMLTVRERQLLDVHALGFGVDPAQLVGHLLTACCKRFVLQDRGGNGPGVESANGESVVNLSGENIPIPETIPAPESITEAPAPEQGRGQSGRRAKVA